MKSEEEAAAAYTELHQQFQELEGDPFEKTAFEYFDFSAWAKSKSTGEPFVDIVKEKAGAVKVKA